MINLYFNAFEEEIENEGYQAEDQIAKNTLRYLLLLFTEKFSKAEMILALGNLLTNDPNSEYFK